MPSPIAKRVAAAVESASWIREMFERGVRLKAERGADRVFDFSLGNPNAPLPPAFYDALKTVAGERNDTLHRYMQNAGFPETRAAIAAYLSKVYPLEFAGNDLIVTSGAAGATNVALRAILEPGDEVIVNAPFFPEYRAYIENAGGTIKVVPTDDDYQLDLGAIEAALSPKTRAIIVCSPNNPSGAVYPDSALAALGKLLSAQDTDDSPI
ncbi:MAG: aminotransferase class I/II-fold pyridoxal phosphate-dependent enzyme, partial [Phycisphaerales bacterium]|nr:aminotransferase class I/II-fold pyridoxal phosphate-dependent enzyme [Phycisphaerales bacterium]